MSMIEGGAIALRYGARMNVVNGTTTFSNVRSLSQGGAIYGNSFTSIDIYPEASVYFINCSAITGGAIYLSDNSSLYANASTDGVLRKFFDSNSAKGEALSGNSGAAIFASTSEIVMHDFVFKNHA